jgi:hypothetical protein
MAHREWTASVHARRSLGENVQVEAWYLAEHFLLAWSDWTGLTGRYTRYFGQAENALPQSWNRTDAKCRGLAIRLFQDRTLDGLVATTWKQLVVFKALVGDAPICSRSLFHALVTSHRRMMLASTAEGLSEEAGTAAISKEMPSVRPPWPETFHLARDLDSAIISMWSRLAPGIRDDALRHLRNYQRATLTVSWLAPDHRAGRDRPVSALAHLVTERRTMTPSIERFLSDLNVEPDERRTIDRVLNRIQAAVAEVGYENFVEDILSGEFLGGPDTPAGSGDINVIPSHANGACCATLLAVTKGEKRTVGFPSVMKQVREHLIRCTGKTRVVVVLCDHWRPDMLDDHYGDLRAHYDRGVRFLFLLVGIPGRALSPVAVDFRESL